MTATEFISQNSFKSILNSFITALTKMTKTIHINIVLLYYTIKLHFPNCIFGPHDLYTKYIFSKINCLIITDTFLEILSILVDLILGSYL